MFFNDSWQKLARIVNIKFAGREVDMILNRVAIADLSPFGKFFLEGPGSTKFLSSMLANTLPKVRKYLLVISYLLVLFIIYYLTFVDI